MYNLRAPTERIRWVENGRRVIKIDVVIDDVAYCKECCILKKFSE
jgi:hypothetical protein